MNKKFSTLVAALLVSGAGYAVVSTFNAYPLANSPIVKAATANLNVSTRATEQPVAVVATAYNDLADDAAKKAAQMWAPEFVSESAENFYLKNATSSYMATKPGDSKIYIVKEGEANFTKVEFKLSSGSLQTSNGKAVVATADGLEIDKIGNAVSLFQNTTAAGVIITATDLNQTALYYLAENLKEASTLGSASVANAVKQADPADLSFKGNAGTGSGAVTDAAFGATKVKVVENAAGKSVLCVQTTVGATPLYLKKMINQEVALTPDIEEASVVSLDTNSGKIILGEGGYLQITANSDVSWISNGSAGDAFAYFVSELTTSGTVSTNDLPAGEVYLLASNSITNLTQSSNAYYSVTLATDPAVPTFAAIATAKDNIDANQKWSIVPTDGGFYITDGIFYLTGDASATTGTNVTMAVVPTAESIWQLNADGAIRQKKAETYLWNSSGMKVANATTAGVTERMHLYAAPATGSDFSGVRPATTAAEGIYVITNAETTAAALNSIVVDVKVITAEESTIDVPTGDAYNLTANANYYISVGQPGNYLAYINGALANVTSHKDDALTEMWIATEHKGTNGEPTTYSFVNRSTEAGKLAFKVEFKNNVFPDKATFDAAKGTYSQFFIDKDGKVTFTAKATDKAGKDVEQVYYLNFDGANWAFIKDNSTVQNFTFTQTEEGMSLDADYLNNKAGNGSDFSFLFAANAKRDSLKPLKETVLSKSIVAVDASVYTNVFKSYTSNESYAAYAITEGLLFSTSLNNASKETGNKKLIENFRASKFIIVDPTAYSAIIEDKDDNQFFDYIEVSGSDLVDENGVLLADPTKYDAENNADIKEGKALAGVKYLFSNVIFKAQQRQGAQYADPVYVTTPSAYFNPSDNEKGLNGYTEATKLAVAVKKFQGTYYVGAAKNTKNVTPRWEYVYIGTNNDVTYKQVYGIVNIYNAKYDSKGEVYGNTVSGIDKLDTKYITVNMNAPEGQFLVNYANNKFTFTNRESGEKAFEYSGNAAYGLKTVKDAKGNVIKDVYAVANGTDTVKIVLALPETIYDGYKNFDQKKYELTDSVYTMSFLPKVDGKEGLDRVYVAENHDTDHMLTLTTDNADAAKFSMVKFEAKADTVYVSTGKYITSDGKLVDDKAVAFAYTIYNDDNDEYVNYNPANTKEYFFCDWTNLNTNAKATAQKYILKEKGNNNYQLIAVTVRADGKDEFNSVAKGKAYGAFQAPKVSQEANIYKVTDNDIINISVIGAPMYRTVEAAPFDTIRIYKEGSKNVALYAKTAEQEIVSGSNWLAMGHSADVNTAVTKFSMFVDTAYVRANTNKPQYMLVIEPDTVHGKYACGVPGHDLHDSGKIDTVYGKYLTTMIDSIPAWGNKHSNPYYWEDTKYPRLGFVNAKHFGDSLVILNDNGIQHANDTINLNDNSNKFGVYAFRIVNDDTKSFNIETAYDRKADGSFTTGWIKWLNGVPVVAPNDEKDKAEIFSLEATSNDPVANETIGTSTISVVAGNGTVTIKGAAGKKVAISNVLGQAIANTVLSSDNATISAPSGIVVVAVEGEAAVKAIVK